MKHVRKTLLSALVVLVCGWALYLQVPPPGAGAAQQLRATGELKWYRGNLHTHSLWSDGDDYLEMIAGWYRDHGYQFLAFTDHNVLADRERWIDVEKSKGGRVAFDKLTQKFPNGWVQQREADGRLEVQLKTFPEVAARFNAPGEFLLLQGEEVSDSFAKLPIHMNATNVKELIIPRHGESVAETIQNNTDALIAQRERTGQPMLIHLNHPNFGYGVTAEDLIQIRGENFFEVYNGHPGVKNSGDSEHASTERIWDIINTRRLTEFDLPLLYGLATDDGHNYHKIPSRASEPGRGWVMVLAPELSPAALIESMERGRFYASSGVTLESVSTTNDGLDVVVRADTDVKYVIEFVGTRRGFDPTARPVLDKDSKPMRATQRYSDDIGAVFQGSEGPRSRYQFRGDEIYVRARITSSRVHPNPSEVGDFERAWTQPTLGPAAK